jgi:hypothetical protein
MGGAPAGLPDVGVAGIKWFATCADNTRRGLPRVPATIVLCDSRTGLLRGIVDATALTAWRTAALATAAIGPCVSKPVGKAAVIRLGAIGQVLAHYLATDLGVGGSRWPGGTSSEPGAMPKRWRVPCQPGSMRWIVSRTRWTAPTW